MKTLTKGTRIYNNGDLCNPSHFGVIEEVIVDRWGTHYWIVADNTIEDLYGSLLGVEDTFVLYRYRVEACGFSEVYLGHGGTRFVTEEAYYIHREAQTAKMKAEAEARTVHRQKILTNAQG